MINVKELRIGNRILDTFGKEAEVMKIDSRGGFGQGIIALSAINGDYIWESFNLNSHPCMPIPLTDELLLRMGFEKTMSWTFSKLLCGNLKLVYYLGEKGWSIGHKNYSDFSNLKYAHQLQNLYHALTGEELTIKEDNNE